MPKIKKHIVLLTLFATALCFSQTSPERRPLKEQLASLEQKFNITFNYSPATVEDIFINTIPQNNNTVNALVEFLNKSTSLKFNVLANNIIYISKKTSNLICGYLLDASTQQPLMGATIIETDNNYAISDEKGYFEIILVSTTKNNISIQNMGFEEMQVSISSWENSSCKTIALIPSTEILDAITLEDFLVKGISQTTEGNISIDFDNFEILPGLVENDVLHSVQALPGIMSVDETISNLNIHGGSHDQNLLVWDGIKMYQSGHFFGLISAFNPQITDKATVIDNGSDASFTDGVSGTILMETDAEVNDTFKANFATTLLNSETFGDVPISDNSSIQVAGRKSISEYIKTPIYNSYFSRISQQTEVDQSNQPLPTIEQEFDFHDTALRYLYKPESGDVLRVNLIYINNELKFTEQALIDNVINTRESSVLQSNFGGSVFYSRNWNSTFTSDIEIYETDYTLKANNANIEQSQRLLQKNSVSETGAKLTTHATLSPTIKWKNGYNFTETEITNLEDVDRPLFRELLSKVLRTHALFSQAEYTSINNTTFLKLGIRGTYADKFGTFRFEPRVSLSQNFSDYFNLLVQGEVKHQNTSQIINFQNDFLGIEKRRWQLADDNEFPVIESQQATIGLSFSRNNLLISVKGYHKNVDGITTQSQGFSTKYEFVNTTGSYKVNGVDVLLRKKMNRFNTWLSYAFMDNQYTFSELPENTFRSNFDITHAMTLGSVYSTNVFNISAGLLWRTGKPTTIPVAENNRDGEEVNFKAVNSDQLENYIRTDISALYKIKNKGKWRAEIGCSILNVFNQESTVDTYYRIINDNVSQFDEHSLEISTNALLRISI